MFNKLFISLPQKLLYIFSFEIINLISVPSILTSSIFKSWIVEVNKSLFEGNSILFSIPYSALYWIFFPKIFLDILSNTDLGLEDFISWTSVT